jgi:gliding motility-associated-like protein
MIRKFYLILFAVACFFSKESRATHMMGGDCQWKCLGNDTYEITVVIYRRCTDGAVSLSAISPTITSDSCANSYNVNPGSYKSWTIEDITPVCNQSYKPCTSPNGSGGSSTPQVPIGVEKHTFVYKVYLGGSYANCCWYKIKFEQSARNSNITTGYADQNFYTESWLNRCATPCDNGPEFKNPPVAIKCAGQDVCFNHGVFDADGDSLSYIMAVPLVSSGSGSLFTSPWSPTYPLTCLGGNNPNPNANPPTGFNLDPVTGDMCFRPMQVQITVLKIQVTEWRKVNGVYQVIGKTARDLQFIIVQNCNNKLPSLSGPFTYEACAGQQICITINTNDQDFADTTRIFWNKGIPAGQWSTNNGTVKHASGQMCWTPGEDDASSLPYYFTATVNDDHCPLNGSTTRSYGITVKPTPKNNRNFVKKACGLWTFTATPTSSYFNGSSYKWYEPKLVGTGSPSTIYSTAQSTSYQFRVGGKYVVRSSMTFNGCSNTYYDTLLVDTVVSVIAMPDTFVCAGKSIPLTSTPKWGVAPFKYKWSSGPADTAQTVTITPTTPQYYYITITDKDTCSAMDSVYIDIKPLPVVGLPPDERVCSGDSFMLDAQNPGYYYLWKKNGSNFSTSQVVYVHDSAQYTLTVIDTFGCEQFDTFNLFVNNPVVVGPLTDQTICYYDTTTLTETGADSYVWTNNKDATSFTGNSISVNPTATTTYYIKGTKTQQGTTCYGYDTVMVNVNPLPTITFPTFPKRCVNGGLIQLLATLKVNNAPVPPLTEKWYCTSLPSAIDTGTNWFDPTKAAPNGGFFWVTYEAKSPAGCLAIDSVQIEVVPPPYVSAGYDKTFCVNFQGTFNLDTLSNPFGGSWYIITNNHAAYPLDSAAAGGGKYSYSFNPSLAGDGPNHTGSLNLLVYRYKDILQPRCENTDTVEFDVTPIPVVDAGVDTAVCVGSTQFNLTQTLHADPMDGSWTGPGVLPDGWTFNPSYNTTGSPQTYTLYYEVSRLGCSDKDSLQITVNPIPQITLSASKYKVCKTEGPISLMATPGTQGSKYYLDNVLLPGNSIDPANIDTGSHIVKYSYTNPSTNCSKDTTITIYVEMPPKVSIDPAPGVCAKESQTNGIALHGHSYSPYGFKWINIGGGMLTNSSWSDSTIYYIPTAAEVAAQKMSIALISTGNSICAYDSAYQEVVIFPTPVVNFNAPLTTGCVPFKADFYDSSQVGSNASYSWDFGDPLSGALNTDTNRNTSHTYLATGIYSVKLTVKSKEGCDETYVRTQWIEVYPIPVADFKFTPDSPDWATVALPKYKFVDQSKSLTGIKSWEWDFGDGSPKGVIQNPEHIYKVIDPEKDTGWYTVTLKIVAAKGDCYDEVQKRVFIAPDLTVFIPNAFSPDDNGTPVNEKFRVVASGVKTFEIRIFDRWGEQLYISQDYKTHGWDGTYKAKVSQMDVYIYKVIVTGYDNMEYEYDGTFHLIR